MQEGTLQKQKGKRNLGEEVYKLYRTVPSVSLANRARELWIVNLKACECGCGVC